MTNSQSATTGSGVWGDLPVRRRWFINSEQSSTSGTFSGSGAIALRISAGGPPMCTATGIGSPRSS